jgi:hypothetical protein
MSRTLAAYRAARAVELALEGWSFDEIAVELGFADRSGAWRAAQRCLARRQQVAADAYVAGTLADLEIIQERVWPRAAAGDVEAGRLVLRAIEDRVRLVELMSTTRSTAGETAAPVTARPGGTSDEAGDGYFWSLAL